MHSHKNSQKPPRLNLSPPLSVRAFGAVFRTHPNKMRVSTALAAIAATLYITKPSAASLRRALRAWVRRRHGAPAEVLARGAMAIDELSGAAGIAFSDWRVCVLATIDPGQVFDEDDGFFGAIGILGHWLALRLRQPASGGTPSLFSDGQVLYLGSATE